MRRLYLLTIFPLLWNASAEAATMCPDGSYVAGSSCRMAPDGSYVSGSQNTKWPPTGPIQVANLIWRRMELT